MDESSIRAAAVKGELDSFSRDMLVNTVAVVSLTMYLIVVGERSPGWDKLEIIILGMKFDQRHIGYGVLLLPLLQLFQLRPLAGIYDQAAKLPELGTLVRTSPSLFNPFHSSATNSGLAVDLLSWVVTAAILAFIPAATLFMWLWEVFRHSFNPLTTIFGLVFFALAALQLRALWGTWLIVLGRTHAVIRLTVFFAAALAINIALYCILRQHL